MMRHNFKTKSSLLFSASTLTTIALLSGCGGGGSSSPPLPTVPTPFDASYSATFVPSTPIPPDGQAPTGSISILNGRATLQTTYYIQPSVVTAVQKAIDTGLTNAGYPGAISDNQVPSSIDFSGTGQLDGNGKMILTSTKKVSICGKATLVVDSTFVANSGSQTGDGTYQITFPDNLVLEVKGHKVERSGSCNNLKLREGTVSFKK